jgi:hypothetical protein
MTLYGVRTKEQPIDPLIDDLFGDNKQVRLVELSDLRILTDKQKIEPLQFKRAQKHLLEHLTGRDLVLKSRQVGISTIVEALLFMAAVNTTARIGVIANDDDTTQKMRDMQQLFYDELPPNLKPERTRNNATRAYYPQTKSQVYIATAGNKTAGRGGTYSHIHGTEVAFWPNANLIIAGMMQGVPQTGHVIFESTANGAQGWFYNEVMAAQRGESSFTVHFYPWWWDEKNFIPLTENEQLVYTADEAALVIKHSLTPEQIKWRRDKQRELRELFPQEYPESIETAFLTSGDNVFGDVKLYMYVQTVFAPNLAYRNVAGLDWGQADDYTTLSIIDPVTNREVYLNRWRKQDWAVMRKEILDACEKWRVKTIRVESNSASSNIEELNREVKQRGLKIDVYPFTMSNKLKGTMVSEFKTALQDDGLRLLDVDYATAELQQWQTKQTANGLWQYTHPDGGHDDTIIARIAAWWGIVGGAAKVTYGRPPRILES